ncbi:GFA family protein [Haliangium sp. UPWRP_2]|uniref:GFA family protein n=1 Tax=Haliangium sp. UPWRP_2 TaxID=1931276 RepID=UPI000B545F64|nr:GFA family protein [Haliangium sp. UPWRP_2]PSM31043.1 aldehyde-activating protein [Haliangium sp. UPWRP_2]
MSKRYSGKCFCGAVEIEVTGDAVAQGYCHCASCRSWSAGPVNAFTLWAPGSVQVVQGKDNILSYNKTPRSTRKWCKSCGGHIMTDHPGFKLVDVYAATIPDYPFTPAVHVHYQEAVLRIKDGLPKMKDMPKEMGGSGATLPE